jgi:uncharacterized membrane protein
MCIVAVTAHFNQYFSRSNTMKKILCLIIAAVVAMGIAGCAGMTQSEQRMMTGTAGGAATGAVIGAIAGNAGMGAAIGAGAGLLGGYVYDKHKQSEERAYQRGYQEGQQRR